MSKLPGRFAQKIDTSGECWIWTAGKFGSTGYGAFWLDGKTRLAHRVAWELTHGTVPGELDHVCRNVACVNPDHLQEVSHRENMRRADVALGIRSAVTHCPHGHAYDEANTYNAGGRRHCRACARARYHRNKTRRTS